MNWQLVQHDKSIEAPSLETLGYASAHWSEHTMTTSLIASLALCGVVFFSLSSLFCAVVVFYRPFRLAGPIGRFSRSQILSQAQGISKRLSSCIAKIVGHSWRDFDVVLRLVAFYWILSPSLAMLFMIGEDARVRTSYWIPLGVHLWIWGNIATDYVSFNVTRNCLKELEMAHQPSYWFIGKLIALDFAVAVVMFVSVTIAGNAGFLICRDQDAGQIVAHAWETIFSVETTVREYSIKSKDKAIAPFPMMIVVAATSYIPTLLWVVGMTAIVGLMTLMNVLRQVGSLSAKRAWIIACFGGLLMSVASAFGCLGLYHNAVYG